MRDGSREGVLSRVEEKKQEDLKPTSAMPPFPAVLPRPIMVEGVTYQTQTPVGQAFVTINHNANREPFEVFITIGKSGSDIAAMAEALGRIVSLNLRLHGGLTARERIRQVVAQLIGIGGAGSVGFGKERVRSLPDAVAKVLAKHYGFRVNGKVEDAPEKPAGDVLAQNGSAEQTILKNGSSSNGHTRPQTPSPANASEALRAGEATVNGVKSNGSAKTEEVNMVMQQLAIDESVNVSSTGLFDICPDCGSGTLAYEEGCKKCYSCGYSAC